MSYSIAIQALVWWAVCYGVTEGWLSVAFSQDAVNITPQAVELDILEALNVSDEMRGVSQVKGSRPDSKAWRLHTSFDHVQIPEAATKQLLSKLTDQMSVEFVYRQHHTTVATLLSINSPGKMSPWFRITSNSKINKLFVFYRIKEDNKLHEKVFTLQRADNWTAVAITINGTELHLFQNCKPPDKQKLAGYAYLKFPPDSLIYFRQEPGFKKKLLGSVESAKIMTSAQYRPTWQCSASEKRRWRRTSV